MLCDHYCFKLYTALTRIAYTTLLCTVYLIMERLLNSDEIAEIITKLEDAKKKVVGDNWNGMKKSHVIQRIDSAIDSLNACLVLGVTL